MDFLAPKNVEHFEFLLTARIFTIFFLQNWANLEITLKTFYALIPEPLIVARRATTLKKALNLTYNLSYIAMTWD